MSLNAQAIAVSGYGYGAQQMAAGGYGAGFVVETGTLAFIIGGITFAGVGQIAAKCAWIYGKYRIIYARRRR